MTRLQAIVNALAAAAALLAVAPALSPCQRALAQSDHPARILTRSSAPVLAAGGEKLLFCAANNLPAASSAPAATTAAAASPTLNVTLQILNGVTGAVLAENRIALAPLGSADLPPDPCISFTVASGAFAPSPGLFVARVLLNPQPLPPGLCRANPLAVSFQAFTPTAGGAPTNVRTLTFEPPDPCVRFSFRRGPAPTAANP